MKQIYIYLAEKRRKKVGLLRWVQIEYYLTEEAVDKYTRKPIYGISVVKRDGINVEEENSGGVSHSQDVVKDMLHTLAKGSITPMSMIEIVDDLVTSRLCS